MARWLREISGCVVEIEEATAHEGDCKRTQAHNLLTISRNGKMVDRYIALNEPVNYGLSQLLRDG